MTREEYSELFHKEQLNLVAFKQLFHCDQEVLRLVNAAIAAEREACAKVCYELPWKDMGHIPSNLAFAAAIRARSKS
jgi:hypothetical protein